MRDSLGRVIDHDGEHVGKQLIASFENDVADCGGYVLAIAALDAICECDVARFDPQASRGGQSRGSGTLAAGAGVAQLVLELQAAAGTRKRHIALVQASQRGFILRAAFRLANYRSVPFEAEQLQSTQNGGGRTANLSRLIEILDAQEPAPAMRAGVEIAGGRGI